MRHFNRENETATVGILVGGGHEEVKRFKEIRELYADNPHLFSRNGVKVSSRAVERWVESISEKAIGRKTHPHAFRHSKAHRILFSGGTLVDVAKILGHVSPISTMKYQIWSVSELEARARTFK
jgi:site-specific recombinase XerC